MDIPEVGQSGRAFVVTGCHILAGEKADTMAQFTQMPIGHELVFHRLGSGVYLVGIRYIGAQHKIPAAQHFDLSVSRFEPVTATGEQADVCPSRANARTVVRPRFAEAPVITTTSGRVPIALSAVN